MISQRVFTIIRILSISLALIILEPAQNQTSSDIILTGSFFRTTEYLWSSDSSKLTFYNFELGQTIEPLRVVTESAGWQYLDIATGNLSTGTNIWPLQPVLTSNEQIEMMPSQYIYQSPNNNLLIFGQEPAEHGFYSIALANRDTEQVVTLDFQVTVYPFNPTSFDVKWSEDSHVALISYRIGNGAWRVLHVDIPDFSNLVNYTIREFNTFIDGTPYTTTPALEDNALDISSDGQFVLLIARDSTVTETSTFYDHEPELVLWNPYTGYASVVTTMLTVEQFMQGSFSPYNDARLLFATDDGIFVYNMATNQTASIRADFDMSDSLQYYFSPNGAWLAVIKGDELSILSISSAIPTDPVQIISTLSLLDSTYHPIAGHDPLLEEASIDLASVTSPLHFRANTNPETVGSVKFELSGSATASFTDDTEPYDFGWTPSVGSYTLTATPWSGAGGTGTAGTPLTINFSVTQSIACDINVPASDTTALISAISSANVAGTAQNICLDGGSYSLTAVHNSNNGANGLPAITGNISFFGNGASLSRDSAAPAFRFFYVAPGATLSLANLSFSNGQSSSSDDGGAIYNRGNLSINTSVFLNNDSAEDGGAISSNGGTVTISDSNFQQNNALQNGGAIEIDANAVLTVTNSSFTQNSAGVDGGAIQTQNASASFSNSQFQNNSAVDDGGAVYQQAGTLSMSNSNLSGNSTGTGAGAAGGGLHSTGQVTLTDNSLSNNTAYNGGGIYLSSTASLSFSGENLLSANTVLNNGAGLYNHGLVSGGAVHFDANIAPKRGGAIYLAAGTITLLDSLFSNNQATQERGGALFLSSSILPGSSIHNSCFTANSSPAGSNIYGSSVSLDASDNWWGSAAGAGTSVSGTVIITPFLTACPQN